MSDSIAKSDLGYCVRPDEVDEFWVILGQEKSESYIVSQEPDKKLVEMCWRIKRTI